MGAQFILDKICFSHNEVGLENVNYAKRMLLLTV